MTRLRGRRAAHEPHPLVSPPGLTGSHGAGLGAETDGDDRKQS
ncbi:hypothetical protein HNR06_004543 [Nocardiopsis arvandica]|uniref:Uncharacterized protein n=1 Tax=Nocardiopsis sinuspersici TaxID=501010 RepID=A0A7Y9XFI9_9ACTN|nr:hypothetical protein [Nocardiopsis sinuspersici]